MGCFGCTGSNQSSLCWRRHTRKQRNSLIRGQNTDSTGVFIVPFTPSQRSSLGFDDHFCYSSTYKRLNRNGSCERTSTFKNFLNKVSLPSSIHLQRPTSLAVSLVTAVPATTYWMQRTTSEMFTSTSPLLVDSTMRRSTTSTTPLSPVSSTSFMDPMGNIGNGLDYNEKLNGTLKSNKLKAFRQNSVSIAKHLRMHKLPQPQRCQVVFEALDEALKQCILVTEQDIESLHSLLDSLPHKDTAQEEKVEIQKQLKAAERYLKRLVFHRSRIDELRDLYHSQLATIPDGDDGQRFKKRHQKSLSATSTFKGAFKDLVQVLCKLETELEMMCGTLNVDVRGIAGFARLAPGDVFEVQLKCGAQKWKSKVKIGTDRKQTWDAESVIFKCMLEDYLEVKVFELKGFGKSVLLIEKMFDPIQLFRANPQLITLDLNRIGSIKLSLQSTWNPLDGLLTPLTTANDLAHSSLTLSKSNASNFSSLKRNMKIEKSTDFKLAPSTSVIDVSVMNGNSKKSPSSEKVHTTGNGFTRSPSSITSPLSRVNADLSIKNWGMSIVSSPNSPSTSDRSEKIDLAQIVRRLKPILHSASARFEELCPLENIMYTLDALLTVPLDNAYNRLNRNSVADLPSEYSVLEHMRARNGDLDDLDNNVLNRPESARTPLSSTLAMNGNGSLPRITNEGLRLGPHAFDFPPSSPSSSASSASPLNQNTLTRRRRYLKKGEAMPPFQEGDTPRLRGHSSSLDRPKSSIFGIHHADDEQSTWRRTRIGPAELDVCLHHHLIHCELLLQKLAGVGPLHHSEHESLCKLAVETSILSYLMQSASGHTTLPKVTQVLNDLDASTEIQDVWLSAAGTASGGFYLPATTVRRELRRSYGHIIQAKYEDLVENVLDKILHLLTDRSSWEPDIITVFQFVYCFHEKQLMVFIESMAHETWIVETLNCGIRGKIQRVIERLKHVPVSPPPDVLRHIGIVLINEKPEVGALAEDYLVHAQGTLRADLINAYLAFLEHEDAHTRRGACRALAVLNAQRCMSALAFISHNDRKAAVREEARRAVAWFGVQSTPVKCENERPRMESEKNRIRF